jgi:hypothetical protein
MWSKLWNLKIKKSFQTCDYVTFAINVTKIEKPPYPKFLLKKACGQHFYTQLKLKNQNFLFWETCNKAPQFTCNYNQETLKRKKEKHWNTHKSNCNKNTCDCQ